MSVWTDHNRRRAIELWNLGASGTAIAKELGFESRNTVIGFIHREKKLGTPMRQRISLKATSSSKRSHKRLPDDQRVAKAAAREARLRAAIGSGGLPGASLTPPTITGEIGLLQLTDKTCRWPIGDPRHESFHFCGAMPEEGAKYCPYHRRIAYQPLQDFRALKRAERLLSHEVVA